MNDKEIIQEIISILKRDGDLITDGECIDAVWELLEKNHYMTDSSSHVWTIQQNLIKWKNYY